MGGDPYGNKFQEEICHPKKPNQDGTGKNDVRQAAACVILWASPTAMHWEL